MHSPRTRSNPTEGRPLSKPEGGSDVSRTSATWHFLMLPRGLSLDDRTDRRHSPPAPDTAPLIVICLPIPRQSVDDDIVFARQM